MNNKYINIDQIKQISKKKSIYIYGYGKYGRDLATHLKSINFAGFIDSYKENKSGTYNCVKLENYAHKNDDFIVIASIKYYQSMSDKLIESGLDAGEDFAIFDNDYLIHSNASIDQLISWNRLHFKQSFNNSSRILIPFENIHDSSIMTYAYYSNYYSEKYNAKIDCFIRRGDDVESTSTIVREMYYSFGANIINIKLDSKEIKEANDIFMKIWNKVNSIEDIKNIRIYGIHFGTTIIRDYLRHEIPQFDVKNDEVKLFIEERVKHIVFWYHRIMNYDYKIVILWDGVHWEGYIRDIAIGKNIPCFALHYTEMRKLFSDYYCLKMCEYYPEFWNSLSNKEKKVGLQWSHAYVNEMITRWTIDANKHKEKTDSFAKKYHLLEDKRIRVVIAPHIFEEDCYHCGSQIFDDDYFSWLCHLGELSKKTNYIWFIKPHPAGGTRDKIIIINLIKKYPLLHLMPSEFNAIDLKRLGVEFGLTVNGTIGEEYPILGINVINAGKNPHDRYGFNINPSSKKDYDNILLNLDHFLNRKFNKEELYEFYAIHRFYYNFNYYRPESFWDNQQIEKDNYELEKMGINKKNGVWKYDLIVRELDEKKHLQIKNIVRSMIKKLENIRYDDFYKLSYDNDNKARMKTKIFQEIDSKL